MYLAGLWNGRQVLPPSYLLVLLWIGLPATWRAWRRRSRGQGAVFWMTITAPMGMALAFAEGALAIRDREKTSGGVYPRGLMTYNYKRSGTQMDLAAPCSAAARCSPH
jgi:hypothetical protein